MPIGGDGSLLRMSRMAGQEPTACPAEKPRGPVRVEVLIVSYRTRDLLRQTLESLFSHPPDPSVVELIVAVWDNASDDDSAEMVARTFPSVRLVRCERNVGFAAANNGLARTSDADYLLLLNSDVIVTQDIIVPLLEALRRDPVSAIAGPRLVGADGAPQPSSEEFPTLRFELARAFHQTRVGNALRPLFDPARVLAQTRQHELIDSRSTRHTSFLWATCWLIARTYVSDHGLFDERYTMYDEDLDFCRRLCASGKRALFVPSVQLVHLGGSSSTTASKLAMTRRSRARYYGDHHGRIDRLLYRFVIGGLLTYKRLKGGVANSSP